MKTLNYQTITNSCGCEDETGEATDCYGYCWEDTLNSFAEDVAPLFDNAEFSGTWRIEGFPLWNGNVDGFIDAQFPSKLLAAITVNGEWILRYNVTKNGLDCILSHHDVPTGRGFTVVSVPRDDD